MEGKFSFFPYLRKFLSSFFWVCFCCLFLARRSDSSRKWAVWRATYSGATKEVSRKRETREGEQKAKGLCKNGQVGLDGEESGKADGGQKEYENWLRSPA